MPWQGLAGSLDLSRDATGHAEFEYVREKRWK